MIQNLGLYGVETNRNDASIVITPVPWDVTTSYGKGTSKGPDAILEASVQLDLFDHELGEVHKAGLHLLENDAEIVELNEQGCALYSKITALFEGETPPKELLPEVSKVNDLSARVNQKVYEYTKKTISEGKIPAVIGGDHSAPFGAFCALSESVESFGVLHFDAHMDFRNAYQGFQHSHASIMRNLMGLKNCEKIVQVGIRDFSQDELAFAKSLGPRCDIFFDIDLRKSSFDGKSFKEIITPIINALPKQIWISFDIDGLDPTFCPSTGTPVPGGLSFDEANYILSQVVASGRKVLGFDLCEVAPGVDNEWDANVGMRLLYKLCGWTLKSQNRLR